MAVVREAGVQVAAMHPTRNLQNIEDKPADQPTTKRAKP
jgi:hypothetical protein